MENFSINDKQDLDYDLPNFTSTKYNSTSWKLCHGTTYFLFSFGYLTSSVLIFTHVCILKLVPVCQFPFIVVLIQVEGTGFGVQFSKALA